MRQIKFRGKVKGTDEWKYGSLLTYADGECNIITETGHRIDTWIVDPSTVGQFTGLTDCNGQEIYEGDMFTTNGKYPRVVLWDKMSWALMPTEYFHDEMFWVMNLQHPGIDWWEEFADEFEVIGNIHDNSEMIKR